MKALPLEQRQLLELQQLDLQIARVNHLHRANPLHQQVAELEGRSADLRVAKVALEADLAAKNRQIKAVEAEIEKVTARRNLQQQRLDEGKVPLRDMSPMQHEIAQIETRIGTLENEQLDLLAEAEKLEEQIASAQKAREAIAADLAQAEFDLAADGGVSTAELGGLQKRRDELADLISAEVLAEYTRLQGRLGTSVVLEVRNGRTVNSPVELSLAELAEISSAPADEIYLSDEHEYMVVRTTD